MSFLLFRRVARPERNASAAPPRTQKIEADEQGRYSADDEADGIAAGEREQSGVDERHHHRAELAERENAAGDRAALAFGRETRGFGKDDPMPGERGCARVRSHRRR